MYCSDEAVIELTTGMVLVVGELLSFLFLFIVRLLL